MRRWGYFFGGFDWWMVFWIGYGEQPVTYDWIWLLWSFERKCGGLNFDLGVDFGLWWIFCFNNKSCFNPTFHQAWSYIIDVHEKRGQDLERMMKKGFWKIYMNKDNFGIMIKLLKKKGVIGYLCGVNRKIWENIVLSLTGLYVVVDFGLWVLNLGFFFRCIFLLRKKFKHHLLLKQSMHSFLQFFFWYIISKILIRKFLFYLSNFPRALRISYFIHNPNNITLCKTR